MDVDPKDLSTANRSTWLKRATILAWFTIIYNIFEASVSIWFGIQEEAIALAGFGVESLIEVASATLVLWRFKDETKTSRSISLSKEKKATWGIGVLLLFLAIFSSLAALYQLFQGQHPDSTLPGVIISLVSLSFMVYLWKAKIKVAQLLNSFTMQKDADCSLACIKLSVVLLLGSFLHLTIPQMWWADATAALIISFFIGKEGWETIKSVCHKSFSGGCNH
jgi:divalent metal cation (Fe/Co/Zn/Cd) transporter